MIGPRHSFERCGHFHAWLIVVEPDFEFKNAFPLLFGKKWPVRGMQKAIAEFDVTALSAEYQALVENAPRRSRNNKKYFVGHTGIASTSTFSNRLEEHWAMALYNLDQQWPRPDGGSFRILDYQVPLKSRRGDAAIGKIDLLAVSNTGQLIIIELKVETQGGGRSDPPPVALMEGLRYAAMVQADMDAIAAEAEERYGVCIDKSPPIVQLLAPLGWWRRWLQLSAAGPWEPAFAELTESIETQIGVRIECMALENTKPAYGLDARPASFTSAPNIHHVRLSADAMIGDALPPCSS